MIRQMISARQFYENWYVSVSACESCLIFTFY